MSTMHKKLLKSKFFFKYIYLCYCFNFEENIWLKYSIYYGL